MKYLMMFGFVCWFSSKQVEQLISFFFCYTRVLGEIHEFFFTFYTFMQTLPSSFVSYDLDISCSFLHKTKFLMVIFIWRNLAIIFSSLGNACIASISIYFAAKVGSNPRGNDVRWMESDAIWLISSTINEMMINWCSRRFNSN